MAQWLKAPAILPMGSMFILKSDHKNTSPHKIVLKSLRNKNNIMYIMQAIKKPRQEHGKLCYCSLSSAQPMRYWHVGALTCWGTHVQIEREGQPRRLRRPRRHCLREEEKKDIVWG